MFICSASCDYPGGKNRPVRLIFGRAERGRRTGRYKNARKGIRTVSGGVARTPPSRARRPSTSPAWSPAAPRLPTSSPISSGPTAPSSRYLDLSHNARLLSTADAHACLPEELEAMIE